MLLNARQIAGKLGKERIILLAMEDITARKQMEAKIHRLAYHDQLTGLPNRMLLLDHLNLAINQANRNRMKVSLMMLDLDKFKEVNDSLGHHIGDKLLQAVAEKLTAILRKADTVARFGGDEFVLLLPEQKDEKTVLRVAGKISEAFRNPVDLDGHSLVITSSIGIALYPDHGADIDTILKTPTSPCIGPSKREGTNTSSTREKRRSGIIDASINHSGTAVIFILETRNIFGGFMDFPPVS